MTYEVTYTKRNSDNGTILVRASNPEEAIQRATYHCFTGKDFRNPVEIPLSEYKKPRQQGFQGSERM